MGLEFQKKFTVGELFIVGCAIASVIVSYTLFGSNAVFAKNAVERLEPMVMENTQHRTRDLTVEEEDDRYVTRKEYSVSQRRTDEQLNIISEDIKKILLKLN